MPQTTFKTIDSADLSGKRVLVRVDLNVPMKNGKVTDATRIERIVPTIRAITKAGGKAVLLSHFGRPKGKVDKAFADGGALWLTDRKGRQVGVPTDKIAYVEIGRPDDRRIGFGG